MDRVARASEGRTRLLRLLLLAAHRRTPGALAGVHDLVIANSAPRTENRLRHLVF